MNTGARRSSSLEAGLELAVDGRASRGGFVVGTARLRVSFPESRGIKSQMAMDRTK